MDTGRVWYRIFVTILLLAAIMPVFLWWIGQ